MLFIFFKLLLKISIFSSLASSKTMKELEIFRKLEETDFELELIINNLFLICFI